MVHLELDNFREKVNLECRLVLLGIIDNKLSLAFALLVLFLRSGVVLRVVLVRVTNNKLRVVSAGDMARGELRLLPMIRRYRVLFVEALDLALRLRHLSVQDPATYFLIYVTNTIILIQRLCNLYLILIHKL